jgi:hypothetical protein
MSTTIAVPLNSAPISSLAPSASATAAAQPALSGLNASPMANAGVAVSPMEQQKALDAACAQNANLTNTGGSGYKWAWGIIMFIILVIIIWAIIWAIRPDWAMQRDCDGNLTCDFDAGKALLAAIVIAIILAIIIWLIAAACSFAC